MELFVSDRVENIVGQGENAGFPAFSAFLTVFQRFLYQGRKNLEMSWKGKSKVSVCKVNNIHDLAFY